MTTRLRLFPGMIFGLIGLNVTVVGITVYFAYSDKTFAVEPNYDRKAETWNQTAMQNQRNAALGWTVALEALPEAKRVRVHLRDAEGEPVVDAGLSGLAFRSLRASRRLELEFTPTGPGAFEAPLLLSEPGLWEFRLRAQRGLDVFTARAQAEVFASSEGP